MSSLYFRDKRVTPVILAEGGGGGGYNVYLTSNNINSDSGILSINGGEEYYLTSGGGGGGNTTRAIMPGVSTIFFKNFDHWGTSMSTSASWGTWRPHGADWQSWNGSGGTFIQNGKTGGTLTVSQDIDLYILSATCLTGDTLILMADGSLKRIDTIRVGDLVKGPENAINKIIFSDAEVIQTGPSYDLWIFEDGTQIKTVNPHRFYNCDREACVYMTDWEIGEHALNAKGEEIALIEHRTINEEVRHYTIFTDGNNTYFANGLLSGNRHSTYKRRK